MNMKLHFILEKNNILYNIISYIEYQNYNKDNICTNQPKLLNITMAVDYKEMLQEKHFFIKV